MLKYGIDQQALVDTFAQATVKQGEAVRRAVHEATLKALQGRELTLSHIKQVLKTVATSASAGAATSTLPGVDVEALLAKAVAGMDGALEQAVEANRRALRQLVDQGATLRETQFKKALADVDKMEETLLAVLGKLADDAGTQLQAQWSRVLDSTKQEGTGTGTQAATAIAQLMEGAKKNLAELKAGRALSVKASKALFEGYATLASGVLIGLSGALQQAGGAPAAAPATARARKK